MSTLANQLVKNKVFSLLSEDQRETLERLAVKRAFSKGEFIAHYGDQWQFIFLVERGLINVTKLSSDGRTLGDLRMGPGHLFWNPCIFDGGPMPASLESRTPSILIVWHREHIVPLLKENPDALWEICLELVARIRKASGYVEGLAFQPVAGRLANLLIEQFNISETSNISRDLTLDEMGSIIGTTPVMVCKILYRFADEGLISIDRTRLSLLDKEKLSIIASEKQR